MPKPLELPPELPPALPPESAPDVRLGFDELYRAHFAFVWRTLRRLGVPEAGLDDATQEVFVVVHRRLSELRPGSAPRTWLFAIAQRVASDQRRWQRRKGGLLPLPDELPAGHGSSPHAHAHDPLENSMRRQAADLVLNFLHQLDEDRRAAFILADLEQMTAREIATAVAANPNTVSSRIASARKAFAAFVAQQQTHTGEPGHG